MAKKNKSPWDDAQAVPRSDIPIGRRGARRARLTRWAVYALLIWGGFASLFIVTDQVNKTLNEPSTTSQAAALSSSPGQGEAQVAVNAWISDQAENGGLTGASLIGWAGSDELPALSDSKTSAYSHTFTVNTDNLGVVEVEQIVFEDKASGAVTASSEAPSITANDSGEPVQEPETTWAGYESAETDTGIDSAITSWARAYTSGDSESVRLAMRDPSTSHTYPTLENVGAVQVNVTDVATRTVEDGASQKEKDQAASEGIARVEITVVWSDGETSSDQAAASDGGGDVPSEQAGASDGGGEMPSVLQDSDDAAPENGTTFTMDVRMTGMTSGTPTVTAWGSSGTGPGLTDYENAYTASN